MVHVFLFHTANIKAIGATISKNSTIRLAVSPYTNTPRNGNPVSNLSGIPNSDPRAQSMNTTMRIFNDIGIGFHPFFISFEFFILISLENFNNYSDNDSFIIIKAGFIHGHIDVLLLLPFLLY